MAASLDSGHNQLRDAGGEGPLDDRATIAVVAVVGEIDANIDEGHGRGSLHSAARCAPLL